MSHTTWPTRKVLSSLHLLWPLLSTSHKGVPSMGCLRFLKDWAWGPGIAAETEQLQSAVRWV